MANEIIQAGNQKSERAGAYMNNKQFARLAKLAGKRPGSRSYKGLRLVLMEGYTTYRAEKTVPTTPGDLARSMRRVREVMEDVSLLSTVTLPQAKKAVKA